MLLCELAFGTFLAYTPRPENESQTISREWMYRLKLDKLIQVKPLQQTTKYLANMLPAYIQGNVLDTILGPEVLLVPMPSSSKLVPGGLWVPQRLAESLVQVGLGASAYPLLKRIKTIPKSAFSGPGERSTARVHYETLSAGRLLFRQSRIVLIDDIITSGATMLGAASVLADAYPAANIKGFAMIRTISNAADFSNMVSPCTGRITRHGESTHREP